MVSHGGDGRTDLEKRVTWERNRRAGKSDSVNVVVEGYRNAEGFWQPNTLVTIDDNRLGLEDAELLIVTARYRFGPDASSGGIVTELELTQKEAFSVEPFPRRRKSKRRRKTKKPILIRGENN